MQGSISDWAIASSAECAGVVATLGPGAGATEFTRARVHFSPDVVSCAAELARGRDKTGDKWAPEMAAQIVGDREGIEMASGWHVANHKGRRFAEAGFTRVTDLCCGIGGDSMGLVAQGLDVLGVDHDETRAWMCAQNASIASPAGTCETLACDVLDGRIPTDTAFHLDPARRIEGRRVTRFEDLMPGPDVIGEIVESRVAGAVKLNPGIDANTLPEGELEIISDHGKLTQAVLWTGSLARHERCATVIDRDGCSVSIHGEPWRSDERSPVGQMIHTMDPSVERADLVPVLIERTGLAHVQPGLGLLTGDATDLPEAGLPEASRAVARAFLTPFEVLAVMPWNAKRVKKHLATLDAGVVEVKTRGGAVHPDQEQRRLRGKGERVLTVFVYRFDDGIQALITRRIPGVEREGWSG
ncbi:MAG: hypothetical protein ACI89L_000050 [Phycisphaerales bacterium]|jgi:hypothetical protein